MITKTKKLIVSAQKETWQIKIALVGDQATGKTTYAIK